MSKIFFINNYIQQKGKTEGGGKEREIEAGEGVTGEGVAPRLGAVCPQYGACFIHDRERAFCGI